jgi:CHAD domain-containing protein
MEVTSDGKWYWVEPASEPVAEAASRILELRMADVQRFLPLAAKHGADDVEYVHQLRVSCRRASAALRAFEPLAGRGARKLSQWLRRLRRAAGPARDADVFLEMLQSELSPTNEYAQELVDIALAARAEAQPALVEAEDKAAGGALRRAVKKCVRSIARAKDDEADRSFAEFARGAFAAAVEGVHAIDPEEAAWEELHELRIASKRLRYSIEIFHSAAAPYLRLEIYPQVEEIQERLGAINDRVSSQWRLQQMLHGMPADGLAAFIAGMIVGEHSEAERLHDEFLAWWSPERQTAFREQIAEAFDTAVA